MKNFAKGFFRLIVLGVMVFVMLPCQDAKAAPKSAKTSAIEVKSTKAESSVTYNGFVGRAFTDDYMMALRVNSKEEYILQITSDGKNYKDINIMPVIKKELGTESDEIRFYDVGAFKDTKTFYITGNIDQSENFLITTKDGNDFTFSSLECSVGAGFELGYIYKVGSNYIYTVAKGEPMGGGLKQEASYWISKDLKKWEMRTTPSNKKGVAMGSMWRLESVTDKGMVISALDENLNAYQLYYTTDLKTFKKAATLKSSGNEGVQSVFGTSLIQRELVWKNDKLQGIQYVMSSDYKAWKTVLNYKEASYSSGTVYTSEICSDDNLLILIERKKDSSLFDYSKKNKKFTEYKTSIKASLVSSVFHDNGYSYMLYGENYILVSKDNFVTSYKFKTPLASIDKITSFKGQLIIQGKDTYYVNISDIAKVMKAKK